MIETHQQPFRDRQETDTPEVTLLAAYFSRQQLAEALDKSEATLWRWEQRGYGPPITKIMGVPYYKRASVEHWLTSLEEKPKDRRGRRSARKGA